MIHFDLVTINAADTEAAAKFWSSAAGLDVVEREDAGRWLVLADGDGLRRLGIQRGAAKAGSAHLDLACRLDEFGDEFERLVSLGAKALAAPRTEPYGRIANLSDPDGNPFDLCAYNAADLHLDPTR